MNELKNNFKIILLTLTFFAFGMLMISCGSSSSNTDKTEQQGKEYTSAYVCPMHCNGSGSDEAGNCPTCGMEYVKNEDHNADGHHHDQHEGHNH